MERHIVTVNEYKLRDGVKVTVYPTDYFTNFEVQGTVYTLMFQMVTEKPKSSRIDFTDEDLRDILEGIKTLPTKIKGMTSWIVTTVG